MTIELRRLATPELKVAWWGPIGWGLLLLEVLLLLYLQTARPTQAELPHYVSYREAILGVEGAHTGIVMRLLTINILLVVALWAAHRGSRWSHRRLARGMRATAVAVALLLGYLTWTAYRLVDSLPELEVREVLERGAEGDYVVLERPPPRPRTDE